MPLSRLLLHGAQVFRHGQRWPGRDTAVLIEDGRIVEYGVDPGRTPAGTESIKLPGGVLIPAYFDAHLHMDQGGRYLGMLALRDVNSGDEVLRVVHEAAKDGEGWLIGIGLRETAWPSLEDLHRASEGRPTFLYTRDYHSAFANRAALQALGLTSASQPPEGGWFGKTENGELNGILHENAVMWAEKRLPAETDAQRRQNITRAMEYLAGQGVLGVSDASQNDAWPMLRALHDEGDLPIRVEHWHRCLDFSDECLAPERFISHTLRRTRQKLFIDGALGSRTAWMLDDYADQAGWKAHPVPDLKVFDAFLHEAVKRGWSLAVHAIGDAGVQHIVRELEKLPTPGGPHRVEHVQHIDQDTLRQFAASDLIASIQPQHRVEDAAMLLDRIGLERSRWAFPMKSLHRGGQSLVLGTDWPVVSAVPGETMCAALEPRQDGEGMPGEKLTLEEALFAYTAGSAMAAGFSGVGRTEPGSPADLIWLPVDPGRDSGAWRDTRPGTVWQGGRLIQQNTDF